MQNDDGGVHWTNEGDNSKCSRRFRLGGKDSPFTGNRLNDTMSVRENDPGDWERSSTLLLTFVAFLSRDAPLNDYKASRAPNLAALELAPDCTGISMRKMT